MWANVNRMLVELTYQGTDWHFDQSLVKFVYFMSLSHYVEVVVDPDCHYDNMLYIVDEPFCGFGRKFKLFIRVGMHCVCGHNQYCIMQ